MEPEGSVCGAVATSCMAALNRILALFLKLA